MASRIRRKLGIVLSVLYLSTLSVLAAIALHSSHLYSLPIPNLISALAIALPPLVGLSLEAGLTLRAHSIRLAARRESVGSYGLGIESGSGSESFERRRRRRRRDGRDDRPPPLTAPRDWTVGAVLAFFLVYETVLVTLASGYIAGANGNAGRGSDISRCALNARWERLYTSRDEDRLRAIQDAWGCCGFADPLDRAWPFAEDDEIGGDARGGSHVSGAKKGKSEGQETCMEYYGRTQGCAKPWRNEEKQVAVWLLIVPLAVLAWTVVAVVTVTRHGSRAMDGRGEALERRPSWLPSVLRLPGDEEEGEDSDEDDEDELESHQRRTPGLGFRTSRTLGPRLPGERESEAAASAATTTAEEEEDESDSLRDEVSKLNKDSNLASYVEGVRTRSRLLQRENEIWVPEDGEVAGAL